MANNTLNIRELIMEILLAIDRQEEHSHILLKNVLDKYDYLPKADKNFIKRVVTGTLEYRIKIDYVINHFSKTPVNKMKPIIRNIMRMSVYQIMFMDKVPDSAVCNEAVKLAGKRGFKGLQGFVNGVLRGIIRGLADIKWPDEEDVAHFYEVKYSCPALIVNSLLADYGEKTTEALLESSLGDRAFYVRMSENLDKDEIEKIFREWADNGIEYEQSKELAYAYRLTGSEGLARLDGFAKGQYTVQDLSSMLVVQMADIGVGDTILDICAAPGGKSLHAADRLLKLEKAAKNVEAGRVISRDVSEYKTSLIEENIQRLGLLNIETEVWDACVFDESIENAIDVVIADVPCSGLGVIGRKQDIKYNLTAEGLDSIVELQRSILDNAVRYVKPGGTLMFSTCTMRRAENDANVEYILASGEFELAESRQLFITEDYDGFYIAKLIKK